MNNIIVGNNCIVVRDGSTYSKFEMLNLLNNLRFQYPDNNVLLKRSNTNIMNEWVAHNNLYKLSLWVDHTKDVDIEADIPKWKCFIYYLLSRKTL